MTKKYLITLSVLATVALTSPNEVSAQYGQVLGTYGQVLSSEAPEEVTIVHEVKDAGIGDFVNPVALVGGLMVAGGAYLYIDRKNKASLKDFSFIK